MRILGLDLGVFTSAVGVLEEGEGGLLCPRFHELFEEAIGKETALRLRGHGERSTPAWVVGEVLVLASRWFEEILDHWQPAFVVGEGSRFQWGPGSNSFAQVGEVRGVLHYVAERHPSKPVWVELTAPEVKRCLTGRNTGGDKKLVQRAVAERFGLPELLKTVKNHEADALGLAFTYYVKETQRRESVWTPLPETEVHPPEPDAPAVACSSPMPPPPARRRGRPAAAPRLTPAD
jgi:Holliday junction resolvasome RuvABC endonuclease subunit